MSEDIEEQKVVEMQNAENQNIEEEKKVEETAKEVATYNEYKDACLHVLEQMRSQNSDVTDEQGKLFASSFLAMLNVAKDNPELSGQFKTDMESMLTIDIRKQSQYDLNAHTDSVAEKVGLEKSEELFNKKTEYMTNVYDVLNEDKRMNANSTQKELELCQNIVEKLRTGDFSVNKALDEMIKQHGDIKFNITDDKKIDGHSEIIDKNGEKTVVIDISKEAFENPQVVPFLIAHELGHAIDYIDRPAESNGTIEKEERLADSAAFKMMRGAGYGLNYTEAFIEKVLNNKADADNEEYKDIGKDSDILSKRAYSLARDLKKEKAAVKSSRVPAGNNNVTYEKTEGNQQIKTSPEMMNIIRQNNENQGIA